MPFQPQHPPLLTPSASQRLIAQLQADNASLTSRLQCSYEENAKVWAAIFLTQRRLLNHEDWLLTWQHCYAHLEQRYIRMRGDLTEKTLELERLREYTQRILRSREIADMRMRDPAPSHGVQEVEAGFEAMQLGEQHVEVETPSAEDVPQLTDEESTTSDETDSVETQDEYGNDENAWVWVDDDQVVRRDAHLGD